MLQYFARIYRHSDLVFWLATKEIKVRYKMPVLGFLWALLVPLFLSLILWFVFTKVLPMPSTQHPFFLFLIAGIFPWIFFSQSVSSSTTCVLDSGALIRKAAFPRAVIPFSVVGANFFNFVLTLVVVVVIVAAFRQPVSPWWWLLPFAVFFELLFTLGVVLVVSGLQVHFRDIKYITELGLLLWFYATPIFYPLELITRASGVLQTVYMLNPFIYLMELYRLALLGGPVSGPLSPLQVLAVAAAVSFGMFLGGFALFRHQEPAFTDWVLT